MSARIGQACEGLLFLLPVCRTQLLSVGLSIDCSAWVKSGVISEHDMFDRNWAHWTTFTQVCHPLLRVRHSEILSVGCLLVPLCREGLLRPSTEAYTYTHCGLFLRPKTLAPPPIKYRSAAKLSLYNLRCIVRAPRHCSAYNGCRVRNPQ